jgi:hypothetical protein
MATDKPKPGSAPGNPIPCVFALANITPAIPTTLHVGEEEGDIVIAVDLMDRLIGSLLLTVDQALDLSIAHLRRRGEHPAAAGSTKTDKRLTGGGVTPRICGQSAARRLLTHQGHGHEGSTHRNLRGLRRIVQGEAARPPDLLAEMPPARPPGGPGRACHR